MQRSSHTNSMNNHEWESGVPRLLILPGWERRMRCIIDWKGWKWETAKFHGLSMNFRAINVCFCYETCFRTISVELRAVAAFRSFLEGFLVDVLKHRRPVSVRHTSYGKIIEQIYAEIVRKCRSSKLGSRSRKSFYVWFRVFSLLSVANCFIDASVPSTGFVWNCDSIHELWNRFSMSNKIVWR